jgi:hypothetical protein
MVRKEKSGDKVRYRPAGPIHLYNTPTLKSMTRLRIYLPMSVLSLSVSVFLGADNQKEPKNLPTTQKIEACIKDFTGLSDSFAIESFEQRPLAELRVPFLTKNLATQPGLVVTIGPGRLNLKSTAKGRSDRYARRFVVRMDANATQFFSITSTFEGQPTKDIVPDPSLESVERQLRAHDEIYHSIPTVVPKITFLDALDTVLTRGVTSPLTAKEIDGLYVMYSYKDRPPRAVWVIMMRGADPAIPHGDGRDWQRARLRHVVDAATGQILGADSLPVPSE